MYKQNFAYTQMAKDFKSFKQSIKVYKVKTDKKIIGLSSIKKQLGLQFGQIHLFQPVPFKICPNIKKFKGVLRFKLKCCQNPRG